MATTDPLIGTMIDDYAIQSLIGRGGMARVYDGYDQNLHRHAAIKVIDSHLIAGDEREEYYERFQREARSIARLRHPNIVQIYRFGQIADNYYMAMEFISGEDLRQLLKHHNAKGTMMPNALVLKIMRAMASALDYAHEQGVIHRDIKPSNILVTEDGTAILTDFGLALNVPEGTVGNTFGSAHYIAPEQAVSSAQAVAQSDLYSLGVVLYEMLTGRVPFDDASAMSVALKHLSDPPPPPSHLNPDISMEVEQVILKVLSKEPEDRYDTGAEFILMLERAFSMTDEEETHKLAVDRDASKPRPLSAAALPQVQASVTPPPKPSNVERTQPEPASIPAAYQQSPATIHDLEKTSARLKQLEADEKRSAQQIIVLGIAAALLLMIIFGVIVFTATDTPTSPTQTVVMAAGITEEVTNIPTETPPTEAATDVPSPEPTEPPAVIPPTDIPPTSTPTEPQMSVILEYDERSFVVRNPNEMTVNVQSLRFIQDAREEPIEIDATLWESGNFGSTDLPTNRCLQFWITSFARPQREPNCQFLSAWNGLGNSEAFWIGEEGQSFVVQINGSTVVNCPVNSGTCTVPVVVE